MGAYSWSDNGGLLLPSHSMEAAAIDRALKERDPDLALQGQWSRTYNAHFWKVVRYVGSERPPETVCVWMSDAGEPLPLSSALLDEVDRLDRNTRSRYLDDVARNELQRQQVAEQTERDVEAIASDWDETHGRPVLPRSQSLRMARDKQRARGKKV